LLRFSCKTVNFVTSIASESVNSSIQPRIGSRAAP